MKKILYSLFYFLIFISCSNTNEYKENLNQYKNLIKDINAYFTDNNLDSLQLSHYFKDDFIFHSYPAGHKKGVEICKSEYIENLHKMKKRNMSINIGHSIYLPGIDEVTYKLNGSVRVYYGALISNDTINVEFSGYQTVDFEDGFISGIWEWADYGGVNNQLMNK